MSGRSWPGCARRTRSWRWSVMCSSAAWPSGSRTRWGGSGGRPDRRPEGSAQDPARDSLPALGVSRSWFCKWKDGTLPARAARRDQLASEVRRLFAAHRGTYGSPRITDDLRDEGWRVSENTVAAVMAELGLAARRKKKRRSTTRPGKGRSAAGSALARLLQCWFPGGQGAVPTAYAVARGWVDQGRCRIPEAGGTRLAAGR